MIVMDAASVTHRSPDTDVSDAEAETFEVHLNSAKLLSVGRTHVGVCRYAHTRQEVAVCQAPLINFHFHILTYYFKH